MNLKQKSNYVSATTLTNRDWRYIINCIEKGCESGEIHSVQDNEEILSGWWFLVDQGIVVKIWVEK